MDRRILSTAAFIGMLTIILGAFGAHALKKVLDAEQLITFETGVRYQMYHALFLIFIATLKDLPEKTKKTIYFLTLSGIFLFSGSIYLLATNNLTSFDFKTIGFVTPIGGLLLILAWGTLLLHYFNKKS
ncbi:DUF423 domain-containing protein [Flavobacterium granuli]|uniref:Uncharacterized membrane protein YgdD (TMEM256/DUF423 family) n=1 Tax=Flavobacterium granuli TaxID=280093 RepID=A0A1M5TGU8_9FLAO|nr:DUF423 domain-containing protein [Flavobacterium granuli]PRZ20369.1 uncharacterized membrane protein YgdD (TMEM256/DUF423 family) [Flavobacterium granuli]SHH49919.1 Uncharacterized membrane protein YgdD, TMEM256/DUF423 family [Flavobacterium granuli]